MRHQRAGDLVHGFARGVPGRQPFLAHQPLHVLYHHDRIVDQQADNDDHGEQGEGVDRIVEQGQSPERAQEHHRDRDGRDQRRAPVLQEHEEDDHHQLAIASARVLMTSWIEIRTKVVLSTGKKRVSSRAAGSGREPSRAPSPHQPW